MWWTAKAGAATDSMPKEKIELMKQDLVLQVPILQLCVRSEALEPNCTFKLQVMLWSWNYRQILLTSYECSRVILFPCCVGWHDWLYAGPAYRCSTETKWQASYSDWSSPVFAISGSYQSASCAYSCSFPGEVILNTCLLLHFSLGHELYKTLTRGVRVQAYWELNEDIADESVLAHIAQHYSVALPPVFDDSIKDQLHQNTVGVQKLI